MTTTPSKKNTDILYMGCPVGSGQKLWGVEDGPEDIRSSSTLFSELKKINCHVTDAGDFEGTIEQSLYEIIYQESLKHIHSQNFPLWIGGDHSQAMSTISALIHLNPNYKIFWIDAHADCNTPMSSPSGNWHGMPLAALLNLFSKTELTGMDFMHQTLKPENVVLFGVRDIDPGEKKVLAQSQVKYFTMEDIKKMGFSKCLHESLTYLGTTNPIHLSFDVDALDPQIMPCTGTPVQGGITYEDMLLIAKEAGKLKNFSSMEIVEYNPALAKNKSEKEISQKTITDFLITFFKSRL